MATTRAKGREGRPKKTERFEGWLTPDQKTIFQRAADIAGPSFPDFVAQCAERQPGNALPGSSHAERHEPSRSVLRNEKGPDDGWSSRPFRVLCHLSPGL